MEEQRGKDNGAGDYMENTGTAPCKVKLEASATNSKKGKCE